MSVQDHLESHDGPQQRWSVKSRAAFVLLGFLAIAGALLFTEHRAPGCAGLAACSRVPFDASVHAWQSRSHSSHGQQDA
jgi:hypothetical protein